MSRHRALRIGMIGKHDLFSPCIQAGIDVVRRPGRPFCFSAESEVDVGDAIIVQPKKHIVSPMRTGKCGKRDAV